MCLRAQNNETIEGLVCVAFVCGPTNNVTPIYQANENYLAEWRGGWGVGRGNGGCGGGGGEGGAGAAMNTALQLLCTKTMKPLKDLRVLLLCVVQLIMLHPYIKLMRIVNREEGKGGGG